MKPKRKSTPGPVAPPLYCTDCPAPPQRLQDDGGPLTCPRCKTWWSRATVTEYQELFTRGGPAGFDPKTGFEAQAR